MQHHATIYAGESLSAVRLPETIDLNHIDTECIDCERLAIDDVRSLRYAALQRPVENQKRIFVIVTKQMPTESQNALLKLFEEPPATVEFHMIVPSLGMLLPTLRSRVELRHSTETSHTSDIFDAFLKANYAERLATVAALAKAKDTDGMTTLFSSAVGYVSTTVVSEPRLATHILTLSKQARQPGASKKMLLEEVALSLPLQS